MSATTIEDLPNEILEKILILLPCCSVLDMTTVSSQFADVIASSQQLMESLTVHWPGAHKNHSNKVALIKSSRKYQSLFVEELKSPDFGLSRFFINHGSTITSLTFSECEFKVSDLVHVLHSVADSLKYIEMFELQVSPDYIETDLQPVKMPKLMTMEIDFSLHHLKALKLFDAPNLKKFLFESVPCHSESEIGIIKALFLSQNCLQDIYLSSNVSLKLLTCDDFVNAHNLRLKKLFLWIDSLDEKIYENLIKLLENQDSLKNLTLCDSKCNPKLMNAVLSLNLETLSLVHAYFVEGPTALTTNRSIQDILISAPSNYQAEGEQFLCRLLKACIGTTTITIRHITDLSFDFSLVLAYDMPNLSSIILFMCFPTVMHFPNIKQLEFDDVETDIIVKMLLVNRQLKSACVPASLRESTEFHKVLEVLQSTDIQFQ